MVNIIENINKTSKIKNLKFEVLNKKKSKKSIVEKFTEFKKYHRISQKSYKAKKTWDIMLKNL